MDPVSHALFGRALNCLDSRRRLGRGAAAACVLGSLAPDIDLGLVTRGWDIYLQYHAIGTHTIAAAPLLAAATAALVRLSVRGSVYGRLFVAALVGVVTGHVLFDLVSGSDMRLFAPLSFRVFGSHLLAMADLSAIAVLAAGTLVSVWRRTAGGVVVVAGLAALLVAKTVSLQVASHIYQRAASPAAAVVWPEAINGSLVRWRYYDRAGDVVRAWIVDAWRRQAAIAFTRDVYADPDVERTRNVPAVLRFFGFAEIPFARVDRLNGERRVLWSDLKYCDAERCAMSFGAVLDERGTPLFELIQLGDYQTRRPLGAGSEVVSAACCGPELVKKSRQRATEAAE
ncbi:MAG: metal-dependent hydrolase [Acidobacteriota bacterium]